MSAAAFRPDLASSWGLILGARCLGLSMSPQHASFPFVICPICDVTNPAASPRGPRATARKVRRLASEHAPARRPVYRTLRHHCSPPAFPIYACRARGVTGQCSLSRPPLDRDYAQRRPRGPERSAMPEMAGERTEAERPGDVGQLGYAGVIKHGAGVFRARIPLYRYAGPCASSLSSGQQTMTG